MTNRVLVDKDRAFDMMESGMTLKAIAKELGVGIVAVRKSVGYSRRGRPTKMLDFGRIQQALSMRDHRHTWEEIAKALGVSIGTVKRNIVPILKLESRGHTHPKTHAEPARSS